MGIIENMSYWECPGCQRKDYIFGSKGARSLAETMGVKFLGEVPITLSIRETSDNGF